jgi:hypothetical protein
MIRESIAPPKITRTLYAPEPLSRASSLPGMVSLKPIELFPDIEPAAFKGHDLSAVRKATEDALSNMNMSMIQAENRVNILCTEHGFNILEGHAYGEMLKTIKDVVEEKTGCPNIRLRIAAGMGFKDAEEIIGPYGLDRHFNGKASGISLFDKGVPIETEIGTLYGIAKAYDAEHFILAYCSDPREFHLHRMIERAYKPFGMSFARLETRSVFHMNFGNRSGNFIARAIFNAPFVQDKFAFSCFLMMSPEGITGIDADNDLHRFDRRLTVKTMRSYGKMTRLFAAIDQCIVIMDEGGWPSYVHAGGLTFGNLENGERDQLDLTIPSGVGVLLPDLPEAMKINVVNPAIRALVFNHVWTGLFASEQPLYVPTIVVGRELADRFIRDSRNPEFMNLALTAENLEAAVLFAQRVAKTDKILIFDGSLGGINMSRALADFMMEQAPKVSQTVDEEFLPKWLQQRGIDPEENL